MKHALQLRYFPDIFVGISGHKVLIENHWLCERTRSYTQHTLLVWCFDNIGYGSFKTWVGYYEPNSAIGEPGYLEGIWFANKVHAMLFLTTWKGVEFDRP